MVRLLHRLYPGDESHDGDGNTSGGLSTHATSDAASDASEAPSLGSSHRSMTDEASLAEYDPDLESIASYTRQSRTSSMSQNAADEAETDDDESSDEEVTGDEAQRGPDGLKYASKARDKDFHKLFRDSDLPGDERLYKVFNCALSKEILYQGRMFVTQNYLCFHSRVFMITHHIVVRISDITKIEPKMTISFIPNAIAIHTTHDKKYLFASFSNRNHVIEVLRGLRSAATTPAGDSLARSRQGSRAGLGPVSSAQGSIRARSSSLSQGISNGAFVHRAVAAVNGVFDNGSTEERDHRMSLHLKARTSTNGTANGNGAAAIAAPAAASPGATASAPAAAGAGAGAAGQKWPVENIGPDTHAAVSLPDPASNEKVLATETVAAPLGVVANLLFGKDTTWLKHFLVDVEHNRELDSLPAYADLKPGAERYFEYTKPLNGAVGPKQTRCKSTEKISQWDTDSYIEVITTTATPNVPSGDSFTTITRAVIAWGPNNQTQIRLGTWLEWTAKSWLKGPIEKGAIDGQTTYCKDLVAELSSKLAQASGKPAAAGTAAAGGAKSGSASGATETTSEKPKASKTSGSSEAAQAAKEWQQVAVGLTVALVVVFLLFLYVCFKGRGGSRYRVEDYEDLRLVEQELHLWQWIDDRSNQVVQQRQKLSNTELEAAIKATEEKLARLKGSLTS